METARMFTPEEVKAIVRDVIKHDFYIFNKDKIIEIVDYRIKETAEEKKKLTEESNYPPIKMIENVFSKELKKKKNIFTQYEGMNIRRDLMSKILRKYRNKEFTYMEAKVELNDRNTDASFHAHFEYLKNNKFIENVSGEKFKFRENVKKWKESKSEKHSK